MAFSGLILVGFVFVHMLGNLNMFVGADSMNTYAHFLQNLPFHLLWINRFALLGATFIHVWMAILLTLENRRAHPTNYAVKTRMGSTLASKTMGVSGSIILIFIFFHIADFTLRIIFPEYQSDYFYTQLNGVTVYNVYAMIIASFSKVWVSLFYIIAMAFLCMHLSHGVSSMFQTVGLRNSKWKNRIDSFALAYGWIIFLGFISVPVCVLLSKFKIIHVFPNLSVLLTNF